MRKTPASTTVTPALDKRYLDGTHLTREVPAGRGAPGSLSNKPHSVSSARRRGTALLVAVEALVPPAVLAVAGVLLILALIFDRDSLAALAL